jgi:hypothetical protein
MAVGIVWYGRCSPGYSCIVWIQKIDFLEKKKYLSPSCFSQKQDWIRNICRGLHIHYFVPKGF